MFKTLIVYYYVLGVGKTSLVHLISHNKPIKSPSWTVGCSAEVKLHEYKEGTPAQKTYFIELWDVGGSSQHRNARSVFYNPTHGNIIDNILCMSTKVPIFHECRRGKQALVYELHTTDFSRPLGLSF